MPMDERLLLRISEKTEKLASLRPFDPGALRRSKEHFDLEMTYNSNAIEGNTLTLSETRLLLEKGITIGGRSLNEHLEVTNHRNAIGFMEDLVGKRVITETDVLNLHAMILDRIDPHNAGFYRRHAVMISGSSFRPPKPSLVPELIRKVYRMLNSRGGDPIGNAAMIHMEFVNIHPFIDGNGRCARLLLNLYLMRNGLVPIIIQKAERKRYIDCIIASQVRGDHDPIINFIARCVERSLDIHIHSLREDPDDYITLAEASEKSRYSQEYLSLLARKGRIGAVKFGRNWMITAGSLEEYENEHG